MGKRLCIVAVTLMCAGISFAQEEEETSFLPNEGTMGIGAAFPFETHPFNVPGEEKIGTAFSFDAGYRRFLMKRVAIGVRGFGFVKELPEYLVSTRENPTPFETDFTLTAFNFGLEFLGLFSDGDIQPFATIMFLYTTGNVTNSESGTLQYNGGGVGGGLGVRVGLSEKLALALEGLGSWGSASWRDPPFLNSTGRKFNPSMLGVLCSASFRWK